MTETTYHIKESTLLPAPNVAFRDKAAALKFAEKILPLIS